MTMLLWITTSTADASGVTTTTTTTTTTGQAASDPRFPADARRARAVGRYHRGQDVRWLGDGWVCATLPGEKADGVLFADTVYGVALVEWPPRCFRADQP